MVEEVDTVAAATNNHKSKLPLRIQHNVDEVKDKAEDEAGDEDELQIRLLNLPQHNVIDYVNYLELHVLVCLTHLILTLLLFRLHQHLHLLHRLMLMHQGMQVLPDTTLMPIRLLPMLVMMLLIPQHHFLLLRFMGVEEVGRVKLEKMHRVQSITHHHRLLLEIKGEAKNQQLLLLVIVMLIQQVRRQRVVNQLVQPPLMVRRVILVVLNQHRQRRKEHEHEGQVQLRQHQQLLQQQKEEQVIKRQVQQLQSDEESKSQTCNKSQTIKKYNLSQLHSFLAFSFIFFCHNKNTIVCV